MREKAYLIEGENRYSTSFREVQVYEIEPVGYSHKTQRYKVRGFFDPITPPA